MKQSSRAYEHPERPVQFLSAVAGAGGGAMVALWLFDGAQVSALPKFGLLLIHFVVLFAYFPIAYSVFPSLKNRDFNYSRMSPSDWLPWAGLMSGLLVWGAVVTATALLLGGELHL